jgi:hypothetical protein
VSIFVDGNDFLKDFHTPLGSITILAETHIFGDHLVLDELLFYPTESFDPLALGVKQALQIFGC